MKKKVLQMMISILYLCLLTCCNPKNSELRLRIVANSNNEDDQAVKIEVKDFVKEYLEKNGIDKLDLTTLEDELNQHFLNNQIVVERTKSNYEAKSYNGRFVQAGSYDTILITIGEGKGKNFWTLLYPEFFDISFEDDHEVEYRSFFFDLFKKK